MSCQDPGDAKQPAQRNVGMNDHFIRTAPPPSAADTNTSNGRDDRRFGQPAIVVYVARTRNRSPALLGCSRLSRAAPSQGRAVKQTNRITGSQQGSLGRSRGESRAVKGAACLGDRHCRATIHRAADLVFSRSLYVDMVSHEIPALEGSFSSAVGECPDIPSLRLTCPYVERHPQTASLQTPKPRAEKAVTGSRRRVALAEQVQSTLKFQFDPQMHL